MSASDFFNRWSKRKTDAAGMETPPVVLPPAGPPADNISEEPALAAAETGQKPPPTLADVEKLTPESDYSAFVAKGVDEDVKRSALKKLFADPHFNVMDGLDTYIGDYTKPDPIPAAMLAALNHARDLLDPLGALDALDAPEKTLMALIDSRPSGEETPPREGEPPTEAQQPQAADAHAAAPMQETSVCPVNPREDSA
jgi:hypothetical protein